MSRYNPKELQYIRDGNALHLTGKAEREWLEKMGYENIERVVQERKRLRQSLKKKEQSHFQYLRNRETRLKKAREYNRKRADLFGALSEERQEEIRAAHRESQKWYRLRQKYNNDLFDMNQVAPETTPDMPESRKETPAPVIPNIDTSVKVSTSNSPAAQVSESQSPAVPAPVGPDKAPEGSTSPEKKADGEEDEAGSRVGEDDDDEDEEEEEKAGSSGNRRPGNPGNFKGEVLDHLEAAVPAYAKLPKGGKEREIFFRNFMGPFFTKFPIEKYPPPPAKPLELVPIYTDEEWNALSADDKKSHKRKVAVRNRSPKERQVAAVKQFFIWRVGGYKRKDNVSVKKYLDAVSSKLKAPRRRQAKNVVMTHPEYSTNVKSLSDETCQRDRLKYHNKAAKNYLDSLDESEKGKIEGIIKQDYETRVASTSGISKGVSSSRYRESFGALMQPIIDGLEEETGLKIVVLAGEDMDGKKSFDSVVLSSGGPPASKIDEFEVDRHQEFLRYFYRWLRDIRVKTINAGGAVPGEPSRNEESAGTGANSVEGGDISMDTSEGSVPTKTSLSSDQPTTTQQPARNQSSSSKGKEREVESTGKEQSAKEKEVESARKERRLPLTTEDVQRRLKEGNDLTTEEYNELPYDEKRIYNRAVLDWKLEQAGLKEHFLAAKEPVKKKQLPRPKKIKKPSPSITPRRSSCVGSQKEMDPTPALDIDLPPNEDTQPSNPDNAFLDVVSALEQARLSFMTTPEAELPDFMDVVNAVTLPGSKACTEWTAHGSMLNEAFLDQETALWPEPPLHLTANDGFILQHADDERGAPKPPNDQDLTDKEVNTEGVNDGAVIHEAASIVEIPSGIDDLAMVPDAQQNSEGAGCSESGMGNVTLDKGGDADDNASTYSTGVVAAYQVVQVPGVEVEFGAGDHEVQYIKDFLGFLLHCSTDAPTRPGLWTAVVYRWSELEDMWCAAGLPSKHAPKERWCEGSTFWNQAGRFRATSLKPPKPATLQDLRETWWIWWSDANPDWRLREGSFVLPGGDGDWSEMEQKMVWMEKYKTQIAAGQASKKGKRKLTEPTMSVIKKKRRAN
ncbi:hypothetical protein VNI00_019003 [Paramarasmius palmivorus]|uniref:Uncharacterized protein n=1 Tax=Paramarasmius palmivorus TaxID=297713 RepID=A0AAW0ATE0_9AGAR